MVKCIYDGTSEALELKQQFTSAMYDLMSSDSRVVLGDADVGFSVYGDRLGELHEKFGDRFFDVGIQEANLVGFAAGLGLTGKIPYVVTFAPFMTRRVYDTAFISLGYAKIGAKLIGCDPGFTSAFNGGSHSALEDVGIMRCIPGITIVDITDGVMLRKVIMDVSEPDKLFYIRMPRGMKLKRVYGEDTDFQYGKALKLREGSDITILAAGLMVARALEAAEQLKAKGISAEVIDPFTIKPLDKEGICSSAAKTGALLCCENHRATGGLCSATAEALMESGTFCAYDTVAVGDRFGEVGPADYLSKTYGLDTDCIVEKAERLLSRKVKIGGVQ